MDCSPHTETGCDHRPALWMDVTQTCQIPMRAGIPRIVRGLYGELRGKLQVMPAQWIRGLPGRYCSVPPGSLEDMRLQSAHSAGARSGTLENWARWFNSRRVPRQAFAPGATWLVPEPFSEGRAAFWEGRPRGSARRVAIFYDATPLAPEAEASARRRARYTAYMQALASFDRVVAISGESKDDLLAFWKSRGRAAATVMVEPLPCDFATGSRRAEPNFEAKRILVVSTLDSHKNHSRFLDACDMLWKEGLAFEVELVGRSSGHTGRKIQTIVSAMANAGRPISWREQVDEEGLIERYRRCSLTVYPSLKEGFGLPILESLWHGRPCVCGSNGAIGETAAGGGCLAVNQADPTRLAAGMKSLLSDSGIYMRLFNEAVRRRFRTWSQYADALVPILLANT